MNGQDVTRARPQRRTAPSPREAWRCFWTNRWPNVPTNCATICAIFSPGAEGGGLCHVGADRSADARGDDRFDAGWPGCAIWRAVDIHRKPYDLTPARMFSDPPINSAMVAAISPAATMPKPRPPVVMGVKAGQTVPEWVGKVTEGRFDMSAERLEAILEIRRRLSAGNSGGGSGGGNCGFQIIRPFSFRRAATNCGAARDHVGRTERPENSAGS